MAKKKMYFGTRERMTWIKCPATDTPLGKVGWQAKSQFINGGATIRKSSTAHKEFTLTWPFASQEEADEITDYADGAYGDGLVYFLDPFAMKSNVLPQYWSIPRLAVDDAPSLVQGRRPTLTDTATNSLSHPTKTATYTLQAGDSFATVYIPIPPDYTLHVGVFGTATGTARVTVTPDGSSAVDLTLLGVTSSVRTNYTLTGAAGATLSLAGEGNLNLTSMIAQVRPNGQSVPQGGFISGKGHSGCRFETFPVIQGYSAPEALDYQSVSVSLTETGAWES